MNSELLGPIIADDEIQSDLRKRKPAVIYQTVKAKSIEILKDKVALEERDGWKIDKKNKKSYRMTKPKPGDELLEDEIWCIAAKMGFTEMSQGRQFKIFDEGSGEKRQIDVFAKDDEIALVIECTQCPVPKTKNMSALIQKLRALQDGLRKSIKAYYGRKSKLKIGFAIATRNVRWRPVDREECEINGITILAEPEIEYYQNLTISLRTAARYQFLGQIFSGIKISLLLNKVTAMKGEMGGDLHP